LTQARLNTSPVVLDGFIQSIEYGGDCAPWRATIYSFWNDWRIK